MDTTVIIGTRGSRLALWQADWVRAALQAENPGITVKLEIIKTKGDRILDVPLAKIGGKGLFVKEIEAALLEGRIDLAVHSMKDMPADIPDGLCVGAVPEREDPRDVLISARGVRFGQLPDGARIGTSSLRRIAQLRYARPDVKILPLRGNLDTRIDKLEKGDMDAIVLAAAGVRRLGFEDRITEYLEENIMLSAVGQGALCIETRDGDPDIGPMVSALDHRETRIIVSGERAFSERLEGGCQVPIAALGEIEGEQFRLNGLVADTEGKKIIKKTLSGNVSEPEKAGISLAEDLLGQGADDILEKLRTDV